MGKKLTVLLCLLFLSGTVLAEEGTVSGFSISAPKLVLTGVTFEVAIQALDENGNLLSGYSGPVAITGIASSKTGGQGEGAFEAVLSGGTATIRDAWVEGSGRFEIQVADESTTSRLEVRAIPAICSILPPLVAIALALIFRQVVVSLFAGIWLGAFLLFDFQPVSSFFHVLDYFLVNALADRSHVQIVLFSLLFGGMVGVITSNGGARGIANIMTRFAKTPRGGQLSAWGLAFVLFFDDYANVLIRGNLMRPITDRLRVSREKLAFLVDTGAATVASIFIISTWIGYEVGLIEQGLEMIGSTQSAYSLFVQTIPFRFYPILALILAALIALTGREIGPMWEAEQRARVEGKVLRDGAYPATDLGMEELGQDLPARWYNGLLPVVAILGVGLIGLYLTGTSALREQGIRTFGVGEIMSNADSYVALQWAALSGCLVAILLTVGQRILTLSKTMDAWVNGMKSMMLAMLILILAWSLGSVTEELQTADFLVQSLRGVLSPLWLPALTFIVAAAVAFATGTSWATMAIMMPLVIPLADTLGREASLDPGALYRVLLGVVSSVLAGAVFGDHCSPISDTTILSSMSSACDHIDHVRTQLPYALLAAVVGVLLGDLPTAYGMSPWISILLGTLALLASLYFFGKRVDAGPVDREAP